jgi:hypothetical protein
MFLSLKTTSRGIDRVINKLYVSNFVSVLSTLSSKMYSSMQKINSFRHKEQILDKLLI